MPGTWRSQRLLAVLEPNPKKAVILELEGRERHFQIFAITPRPCITRQGTRSRFGEEWWPASAPVVSRGAAFSVLLHGLCCEQLVDGGAVVVGEAQEALLLHLGEEPPGGGHLAVGLGRQTGVLHMPHQPLQAAAHDLELQLLGRQLLAQRVGHDRFHLVVSGVPFSGCHSDGFVFTFETISRKGGREREPMCGGRCVCLCLCVSV